MRLVDSDLRFPQRVAHEWLTAAANAPARILAMSPDRSPELRRAHDRLRDVRVPA